MAKGIQVRYERILRRRLQSFFQSQGKPAAALAILSDWHKSDWQPYLFGGLLRDILIYGSKRYPRDIDVVLSKARIVDLERKLQPYVTRRTRFGGFQLEISQWHFDVWPLKMTWAFAHNPNLLPIPEHLPRTTFLNVEAVTAAVGKDGEIGDIFEAGFFEAVHRKTLDINLEENPYPALAAVRALATARKLRFNMTERLARYIVKTEHLLGADALVSAQDTHYGSVRFRKREIQVMVRHLAKELKSDSFSPFTLPGSTVRQLSLWT